MNSLTVKIDWNLGNKEIKLYEKESINTSFSNEFLDIYVERVHNFVFDKKNLFYNKKTDVLCAIIGYVSNLKKIRSQNNIECIEDVKTIEKMYTLKGPDFICDLDGIFTIFIWDMKKQKGYIFQDELGSNLPLYYTNLNDKLILSTSLKNILKELPGKKRKLNKDAAYDFLFFKYLIPHEETLIENIYKLIPGHFIIIDHKKGTLKIHASNIELKIPSKAFAKKNLIKSIEDSVNNIAGSLIEDNVFCTISGGFDTTLMLHFLATDTPKKLTAFTIGGKLRSEIPSAKKTVGHFKNVEHKFEHVQSTKLDALPDMVWRLENYTCERGIFMQHELAKLLEKNGVNCIFLGEGADQVIKPQWNSALRENIKKVFIMDLYEQLKRGEVIKPSKNYKIHKKFKKNSSKSVKYNIYFDSILKKSGIMLNSSHIQGMYVYLNRDTRAMCKALGNANFEKRFYKKEVKKVVGKEIGSYLKDLGGSTDSTYIFRQYQDIVKKLLKSEFIKKFLDQDDIEKISQNCLHYSDLILLFLSFYLFNELFISGKFDSGFEESNLDINIQDFFD